MHNDEPNNVVPLRRRETEDMEFSDFPTPMDEWMAIQGQQIEDLRNELLMTNSLIRRLLKNMRGDT